MDFKHYMSQSFNQGKEVGLQEGLQQGLQEGEQKKAIEDARNFYANGASIELIAKSLKMTEEQVRKIVKATASVEA